MGPNALGASWEGRRPGGPGTGPSTGPRTGLLPLSASGWTSTTHALELPACSGGGDPRRLTRRTAGEVSRGCGGFRVFGLRVE